MKATQKDFKGLAARAAREARVFFLCGPDEAGAAEAAALIVSHLAEAGERIELSGADLRRDPVRLGDEARSASLFGGERHIWVRASGDEAFDAVEVLLAGAMTGAAAPCPVVIVASSASDKSRTAKLLGARPDCLMAMFYPPDLRSFTSTVRDLAEPAGLVLSAALAERIAQAAALDVRIAQSEVAKLALYLDASPQAPRTVDAAELAAIGASVEDDSVSPLVNTVLGGETAKLAGELQRIRAQGLSPVGVLLAFERRAAQLMALAGKLNVEGDIASLLKAEVAARRVFWKDERALQAQLRRWRGPRLVRLVERLIELHRVLLANSQTAELLLAHALAEITRAAAPKRA